MMNSTILNNEQINHKIKRIAYQILEANPSEKEIVIAGIATNGFIFAEKLKTVIEEISKTKVNLCEVKINKKNPLEQIETSLDSSDYKNKPLVLVDDVLNVSNIQTIVTPDQIRKIQKIVADTPRYAIFIQN